MSGIISDNTGRGTGLIKAAAAGGGAYTFIGGVTAAGTSPLSITSGIDTTYDVYMIVGAGLSSSADGQDIRFRMSVGASFITSSDYRYGGNYANTNATHNHDESHTYSNSVSSIRVTYNAGSDAVAEAQDFVMYLFNPGSTTMWKNVIWHEFGMNQDGLAFHTVAGGLLENTGAVDGVQIYPSVSGDYTLGTFRLYGLANS